MEQKPKRVRPKVGDVCAVPLEDGTFGFGRVLKPTHVYAFYDLRLPKIPAASEQVIAAPIAFKVMVTSSGITSRRWPIIGRHPLSDDLQQRIYFIRLFQRGENGEAMLHYSDRTGFDPLMPIPWKDAKHLEISTIYEPIGIEMRLLDRFEGRPHTGLAIRKNLDLDPLS